MQRIKCAGLRDRDAFCEDISTPLHTAHADNAALHSLLIASPTHLSSMPALALDTPKLDGVPATTGVCPQRQSAQRLPPLHNGCARERLVNCALLPT